MTRWKLFAGGMGAYAIGLIATLPATFVDVGLQHVTDGRVRLADAQGTFWSGRGSIEILDARRRTGVATSLTWRFRPASLLRGNLVCEVEMEETTRRFPVSISLSGVELANADVSLPAAVLGLGVPALAPLQLGGELSVHVARVAAGRSGVQVNATAQWHAASSALTPVSPLGSYELHIESAGAILRASLRTLEGPLQLYGQGSWSKGSRLTFFGTARVSPQHQQQLAPLLRSIAIERAEGQFEVEVK